MSTIYLVGIDGSESSLRAVQCAVDQAKLSGASITLIHVLEWSPYSFLTPEELDERHKRRGEELSRAKTSILQPVIDKYDSDGVKTSGEVRYGHIADTIHSYSDEISADQIFIGRQGGGLSARLFGSVPGSLVQTANVPTTVVP